MKTMGTPYRTWQVAAVAGMCLLVVGVGAGYFDRASHFSFEFIDDHYDLFALVGLTGLMLAIIGCIGWAKNTGKQNGMWIAAAVFAFPLAIVCLGYPIAGVNVHGPAVPAMLLIIPATILAVTVLVVAALHRTNPEKSE